VGSGPRSSTLRGLGRKAGKALRRVTQSEAPDSPPLPLTGFDHGHTSAPLVELLDDDELAQLNALLPWAAYTVDGRGRRFGDRAGVAKRTEPQVIPDPRILAMHERFDLAGKDVLEVGCFEGLHTIALCLTGARVKAVDVRVVNVVKTIVRCAFYGQHPTVFVCNLETWDDDDALRADFIHHVGVLYHLRDPVPHLLRLGRLARHGLLLDTHIATDEQATESMQVDGLTYRYRRRGEAQGPDAVFAGAYDHAKWLRLDDILALLDRSGFSPEVVDRRVERNGTRVTVMAQRKPS
jgi:2-polyprenyl-3-methyl-5-hydroxy-6-metoxy-1,4-benzoquinol methylase